MKYQHVSLVTSALLLAAVSSVRAQFFSGIDLGNPGADPAYLGSIVTNGDASWTISGDGTGQKGRPCQRSGMTRYRCCRMGSTGQWLMQSA